MREKSGRCEGPPQTNAAIFEIGSPADGMFASRSPRRRFRHIPPEEAVGTINGWHMSGRGCDGTSRGLERLDPTNWHGVGCEVVGEAQKLFREDSGFQLLDPSGVFVELHLNDLVGAAIDGGKTRVRLLKGGHRSDRGHRCGSIIEEGREMLHRRLVGLSR
jgi:hypothetical protein